MSEITQFDNNLNSTANKESEKNSFKKRFDSIKAFLQKTFTLGSVLTVLGIAGGLITIKQFVADLPNLSTDIEEIEFRSYIRISDIIDALEKIRSQQYSDTYFFYTEDIIIDLQNKIQEILDNQTKEAFTYIDPRSVSLNSLTEDDVNQLKEAFSNTNTSIDDNIREIDEEIEKNKPSKIIEEIDREIEQIDGQLLSLENSNIDLRKQLEQRKQELETQTHTKNTEEERKYYEKERRQLIKDKENINNIKIKLQNFIPSIETEAQNSIDNRIISVKLLVENNSHLPNSIKETAIIAFYRNKEASLPVILKAKYDELDDIVIDDNSFRSITLESFKMKNLSKYERKFIESAFENKYPYILVVQDIKGKIWSSEGEILDFDLNKQERKLEREINEILEKKFSKFNI